MLGDTKYNRPKSEVFQRILLDILKWNGLQNLGQFLPKDFFKHNLYWNDKNYAFSEKNLTRLFLGHVI